MAARSLSRWQKAGALVPMALLVAAWGAAVSTGGLATAASSDDVAVPDVPQSALDQPASVEDAPGIDARGGADNAVSSLSPNGIPAAALYAYRRAETLLARLPELVAGFAENCLEVQLEDELSRGAQPSPAVQLALYRIAQEALSNVSRHSGATEAEVQWVVQGPLRAMLRIRDNGCGFDTHAEHPGHFGLDNMRSRAEEIGAVMTLVSAPGRGTDLLVQWGDPHDAN